MLHTMPSVHLLRRLYCWNKTQVIERYLDHSGRDRSSHICGHWVEKEHIPHFGNILES